MIDENAFDRWYSYLASVEGGVVDHDLDKGGATWYGISSAFLEGIGRTGPLSRSDARQIARDYFWEPTEGMATVAAWMYADALFNHTPIDAARLLQHAVGVTADGVLGPKTREAATSVPSARLAWDRYAARRTALYVGIVQSRPDQIAFMGGWANRVRKLGEAMLAEGLFVAEVEKMAWYSPKRVPENAKAVGFGLAGFAGLIALFVPDVDAEGITGLLSDPAALKSAIGGIAAGLIAKWRPKAAE